MSRSLLILSSAHVDEISAKFDVNDLVNKMAAVFHELNAGHNVGTHSDQNPTDPVSIPPRAKVVTANHTVLFMPSRVSTIGTTIKIVSVPNSSAPSDVKAHGLPASTMVIDEHSGDVIAVVNARKLTALRNAASSLLATRILLLDNASPRNIVCVGAGAQISAHLSLFLASYPSITTCKIFNRSLNDKVKTSVDVLRLRHKHVDVDGHELPASAEKDDAAYEEAIRTADIIITATSSTTPLFPAHYVSPGAHLCLIGSYKPTMNEVDSELVKRAGKITVDYKEGAMTEAGELIAAEVTKDNIFELGQLLTMASSSEWIARTAIIDDIRASGDITIFKSVGVGVQDVAIARVVVDHAKQYGIGTYIPDYDDV